MKENQKSRFKELAGRFLAMLLAVFMLAGTAPELMLHVSADDLDDKEYCVLCEALVDASEYCWDCCACEACQNDKSHCYQCGECLGWESGTDFCNKGDHNICIPCLQDMGLHCVECGECCCDDQDGICQGCHRCVDCCDTADYPGGICTECGMCAECSPICPECDQCGTTAMCPMGEEHCKDFCCELCPECEEVCFHNTTYYPCEYCDLCEECCAGHACPDCGMCIEDPYYEEHLCANCGICLENLATKCEECGMCEDCCMDFASQMGCHCGMCWTEIDDEHICEACGQCAGEVEMCEICGKCLDCCAEISAAYGCDCSNPVCVESSEWDAHFNEMHGSPENHSVYPSNVYSFNSTQHWKECRLCDDSSHRTNISAHSFGNGSICRVCGYRTDTPIVINKQPNDVKTKPCRYQKTWNSADPWEYPNHKVLFTVSASGDNLKYKWYTCSASGETYDLHDESDGSVSGSTTAKLRVAVYSNCESTEYFKCRITDRSGHTVWTEPAKLITTHNYVILDTNKAPTKDGHYMKCCGKDCTESKLVKHDYGSWVWEDANHCRRSRTCETCNYKLIYETHDDNEYVGSHFYDEEIGTGVDDWEYSGETGEPNCSGYCIDNCGNAWKVDWTTHTGWCYEGECENGGTKVQEPHRWAYSESGWQGMYHPPTSKNEAGLIWRQCGDCGYYQYAVDSSGKAIQWKWGVHPIDNYDCTANALMVYNNEDFKVVARKKPAMHVAGWSVTYYEFDEDTQTYEACENNDYVEIIDERTAIINASEPYGAGAIVVRPIYEDGCATDHAETEIIHQRAATCGHGGYSGDVVCKSCGMEIRKGEDILPGPHADTVVVDDYMYKTDALGNVIERKSDGEAIVIARPYEAPECHRYYMPALDDYSYKTYDGYSGDKICPVCKKVVERGRRIPGEEAHNFIKYVYDCNSTSHSQRYCKNCYLTEDIDEVRHRNTELRNAVDATCTAGGYTGDTFCLDCETIVERGSIIPPTGHEWVLTSLPEDKPGKGEFTCECCGETKIFSVECADLTEEECSIAAGGSAPKLRVGFTAEAKPGWEITEYGILYYNSGNVIHTEHLILSNVGISGIRKASGWNTVIDDIGHGVTAVGYVTAKNRNGIVVTQYTGEIGGSFAVLNAPNLAAEAVTLKRLDNMPVISEGKNKVFVGFEAEVTNGYQIVDHGLIYYNTGTDVTTEDLILENVGARGILKAKFWSAKIQDFGTGVLAVGFVKVKSPAGYETTLYTEELGNNYASMVAAEEAAKAVVLKRHENKPVISGDKNKVYVGFSAEVPDSHQIVDYGLIYYTSGNVIHTEHLKLENVGVCGINKAKYMTANITDIGYGVVCVGYVIVRNADGYKTTLYTEELGNSFKALTDAMNSIKPLPSGNKAITSGNKNKVQVGFSANVPNGYTVEDYGLIYYNSGTVITTKYLTLENVGVCGIHKAKYMTANITDNGYGVTCVGFVKVRNAKGYLITIYTEELGNSFKAMTDAANNVTLTRLENKAVTSGGKKKVFVGFKADMPGGYTVEDYGLIFYNSGNVIHTEHLTLENVGICGIQKAKYWSANITDNGYGVTAVGYVKVKDANGYVTTLYSGELGAKYADLVG